MGAMENMMASMLQKAIPPDVLAMMTPEKIQEYKDSVSAIWNAHKEQLDRIEQKISVLADIDNTLTDIVERLSNGYGKRNSVDRGSKGRNRGGSGDAGNGSGNSAGSD